MKTWKGFSVVFLAGLIAVSTGTAFAASQSAKKQAEIYEDALSKMTGQELGQVNAKIGEWEFQVLDAWEEINPTDKDITKHNRNKVKFTKKEIGEIFGQEGNYRVVLYVKLVDTKSTTMGGIDDKGMSTGKDLTVNIQRFSVIRVVFRENLLAHYRIWPILDQSSLSGGTYIRR